MNSRLILLLSVCVLSAAMVPRERRAVNTEEEEKQLSQDVKNESAKICAITTPCAWSIYKPVTKVIEMTIQNTYCNCTEGLQCIVREDDPGVNAYLHRCTPMEEEGGQ